MTLLVAARGRRRVFILGILADGDTRTAAERAGQILAVGSRCEGHPTTRSEAGEDAARPLGSGARSGRPEGGVRYDLDNDTYVPSYAIQERAVSENPAARPQGAGWKEDEAYTLEARHHTQMVAAVSENQRAELRETSYARQLTSGGGKPGQGYPMVREKASVRRLTPIECERLQGFPDEWTDLGGTPDSRRYAALGDAVTVNVAHWIGARIMRVAA